MVLELSVMLIAVALQGLIPVVVAGFLVTLETLNSQACQDFCTGRYDVQNTEAWRIAELQIFCKNDLTWVAGFSHRF